jgi:endonuclease YncB( thermonuclease family)
MGLFDFGLFGRAGRRSNPQVSRPSRSNHQSNRRQRHRWRHHQSPCRHELQTVRIIGYDSPEPNQPFGDKASLYLKTLLEGREVILESDVQATDKYGRRLYHVWLPQVLVGELMLLSGLGQIMTIPPNVRHSDYYQRVQTAARSVGLGI